jgi:hypothetical protein
MIEYPTTFLEFWNVYPRKVAKLAALKSFNKAVKLGVDHATLIAGARKYAEYVIGKDAEYIKHPSTWLNGGCWDDEYQSENIFGFEGFRTNGKQGNLAGRSHVTDVTGAALRVAARGEKIN